jgi:hypothetical protein
LLEEALSLDEPTVVTGQYYYVLTSLAAVLLDQGDPVTSLALCDRALAYFGDQVPATHPDFAIGRTCRERALAAEAARASSDTRATPRGPRR